VSGEEQVYSASVPADTETGPETVTAERGSEHHTDKNILNASLTYDSDYLGVVEVSMAVTNMLMLDMWRVGRGLRSWSITTRRGGEGGWPGE
jgi:hypothetical protein